MNWRNTYYEMGTRAVSGFRKPGQSKRSDFVLRVVNPQNAFRNFKEQSLTSDGGKVFSIRWDIAGRGDAWVSRGLSSGGIIRMQDVAGLRARSMLITGGTSWLPEDTVIRPVILNNMGEAHIVQDE
ncbi:hypothetical protein DFQ30_002617 [Apophysomyces sp. BC1015]|nr:hypothetical protein DFQ30_002617 [Apophysomyces sp. BC1015]